MSSPPRGPPRPPSAPPAAAAPGAAAAPLAVPSPGAPRPGRPVPPAPPPPPPAAAPGEPEPPFRVLENGSVEVDEGTGNAFHLGPVLRKFTAARLQLRSGARRAGVTAVELPALMDALGLLRALQYDVAQFNAAAAAPPASASALRYACFRLTRQAAAFGVRVPRAGTAPVVVPGLDELVAYVERAGAAPIAAARALVASGVVGFDALAEFFRPGALVLDRGAVTGYYGVPTALRVRACFFSRGKSLFGVVSTFFVALEFVVAVGDRFAVLEATLPVADFPGTRSTAEGLDNLVALSAAARAELEARGERYARLTTASAFAEYAPGSFLPVARGGPARAPARARGGGRVMVDSAAAYARGVHCARAEGVASDAVKGALKLVATRARVSSAAAAAAAAAGGGGGGGGDAGAAAGQEAAAAEEESLELLLLPGPLPAPLRPLTWPVVAGFSFGAKAWGVVSVAGLGDVRFNEAAFARLVMPADRKRLIEALVLSHAPPGGAGGGAGGDAGGGAGGGADVIEGKGEGTIFLLHGPPGVGKTLTAEAIAELLRRPLYVVSMGELGTSPEALEERLADVLELCAPWRALVLIDEAEMLLERRAKNDIVRNAMVCVMLRLLEYFRGILFLTTNRVESLDPAFQSRVQCALRYDALDAAARRKIWADLLGRAAAAAAAAATGADAAGLDAAGAPAPPADAPDVDALASAELNGRQIKNCLQLALALARHERAPLTMRHLRATLEVTTSFAREAAAGDSDAREG